jgi:electron transfer flavoprotein alpha/beta subunit
MKAKKKPVEGKNLAGLGLAAESVKAVVVNYALPPERKAGSVFKGEAEEVMVPKLVKALREQAKVI